MDARAKALANLYRRRRITKAGLRQAVNDGLITEEQYQEIVGEAYQA